MSKIEVLAGLVSSEDCKGESSPYLSPAFVAEPQAFLGL